MADKSKIEWTDATFNPFVGCTKISPGCDHCYAESWAKRSGLVQWGPGAPRRRTSPANWRKPPQWNAERFFQCDRCGWRGHVPGAKHDAKRMVFYTHSSCGGDVVEVRRRVFCASLADVFDNQVDPQWRFDLFELIDSTPNLDWLLLTKRIGNVHPMVGASCEVLPNIWLGATVVNQEEADRDIPKLLATPARVRFLSMEPLLGPVNLGRWLWACCGNTTTGGEYMGQIEEVCCGQPETRDVIDWVIVGGESGPGARPAQLQWIRSIVRQCRAAGVPVLVKQLGHEVLDDGMSRPGEHWPAGTVRRPNPRQTEWDPAFAIRLKHAKGGEWSEWPEDLRVREFPEVRHG